MAFRSTPVAVPTFATPTGTVDIGDAAVAGPGPFAASSQHVHAFPAPAAGYVHALAAAASDGVDTAPARAGHVHPHPASDHLAGGFADLTGAFGRLPVAADGWQFVTAHGNDANDGLSQGSAKATMAAARAALPTVGGRPAGVIVLGQGTFDLGNTTLDVNEQMSVVGPDSLLCKIIATGQAGDVVRWHANPFTVAQAGALVGVTIDGTAAAAGAAGVHMGDIVGPELDDVVIQNFAGAGSAGLWCDNTVDWTERVTALRLKLENNTTNWRFTVNGGNQSFGYNRWLDVRMVVGDGQTGISVEGTSYVYSNTFDVTANVEGGAGNTAVVLDIKDTSHLYQSSFIPFAMEQTSGSGATSVRVAAGATFGYHGLLIAGGMPFAGTASRFYYHEGDTAGVVAIGIPGNTALTIDGTLGRIFQVGPMAGNVTGTTFVNLLVGVVYTLVFIQDATGGRSISLPGNIQWAGGAFPVWSTTAGYRDVIQLYFDGVSLFEVSRSIGLH